MTTMRTMRSTNMFKVYFRMNREFLEYMRVSYLDTPLSDFRAADTYVRAHGGVQALDDDEDDE
jgi:hypothetical protein